jgi:divalent metal cation (Fe/Co/Zn/Cd) transporter
MLISAVGNWLVSKKLYKVARETNSIALEADALHLKTDVYTSLGVAAGLGLILVTDIKWLDPLVAILVAFLIIYESYNLMKRAFRPLIDSAWCDDEIRILENKLDLMEVNYHDLRTALRVLQVYSIHVEIPKIIR